MSLRREAVIDRGTLRRFIFDTYYARKLGREPTSGEMTNVALEPGERDLPALMRALGSGVLVTGFSGGNVNAATGDFSVGIRGQWIERGEPVRALAEMNLAGNHLELWSRLLETGRAVYPSSWLLVPSLRFDAVQFSGV